jgi:hypothetical protein
MASPVDKDVRADAPPKISKKAGHMEGVMEKVVEAFFETFIVTLICIHLFSGRPAFDTKPAAPSPATVTLNASQS